MTACSTGRTTAPAATQDNKYPVATDAAAVTVVHCMADDSSSSSGDTSMADSRRQRVLRAVRRPVSTGSRQCVNVLKELLPQEVLQEIHGQVSSGVKPPQAVEAVTAQRMGPQVAADVTKLLVAVSLACSAGGGVVQATKALLCLLASPLALGGPMRALTSVLLPTPVAGSLLGACLVVHTAREVLAAGNQQQQQKKKKKKKGSLLPAHSSAAAHSSSAAADSGEDVSDKASSSSRSKRSGGGHWWVFWQRSRKHRLLGADHGSAEASTGDSLVVLAEQQLDSSEGQGDQETCAERASGSKQACGAAYSQDLSPAGPLTPEPQSVLGSNNSSSSTDKPAAVGGGAAADALEAEAAALTAVAASAFAGKVGPHAHPLPAVSLMSCDSSIGQGDSTAAATAAAAAAVSGSVAASNNNSNSSSSEPKQQPAPFPFSPTNSLRPAVLEGAAALPPQPTPTETAAGEAAAAPAQQQQQHQPAVRPVRRSSSGAADFTGSDQQQPLSPTSSGGAPCSPREEIQEQAAEVQRRWSMGAHSDMVPDPESFKLLQQQPYRPPVFTRLSSGRGGCRITAAAAAAAELAARKQQLQQQQQQRAEGVSDEGAGSIRRHHSLDMHRSAEAEGGGAGWSSAGALPPLPEAGLRAADAAGAAGMVAPAGLQQQQPQQEQHSGEMPVLGGGVVRQRSLDWGHRLCKTELL